jgi:hypothetical protein
LIQDLAVWQNFYLLMGGASATLTGLLFVAVSLSTHRIVGEHAENISIFVTPTLTLFVSVLSTAALMVIPTQTRLSLSLMLVLLGAIGLSYSTRILRRMITHSTPQIIALPHLIWHGLLPVISYLLTLGAGFWFFGGSSEALNAVALAILILLIAAIKNAWELMLWIARNRGE